MFTYRNSDARGIEKLLGPDGSLYKGDAKMPVFSWTSQPFSAEEIVTIILGKHDNEVLCASPPINVSHNVMIWELSETMVLGKKHFLSSLIAMMILQP